MPYREKTAWLSLLALALTFGPYFAIAAAEPFAGIAGTDLRRIELFAAAALAQAFVLGMGRLVLTWRTPADDRLPPDERDRAISQRSIGAAYYVLIGCMIVVGCVMPFNANGWSIVNAAVASIVAAEVVHYGVAVTSYRRQT